ncbi:hypothetical protein AAY473_027380 [Plecturocebus cupreus]
MGPILADISWGWEGPVVRNGGLTMLPRLVLNSWVQMINQPQPLLVLRLHFLMTPDSQCWLGSEELWHKPGPGICLDTPPTALSNYCKLLEAKSQSTGLAAGGNA